MGSVFKLEMAFSTLAKRVPTFPFRNGSKTPKNGQVGVTSCTPNGVRKARIQLWLTLTPYSKTLSRRKREQGWVRAQW